MRSGRLLRDFVLIPLPIGLLAAAFFLGGVPEGGALMVIFSLGALWFIRPRKPASVAASIPTADQEEDIAPEVPSIGGPPSASGS